VILPVCFAARRVPARLGGHHRPGFKAFWSKAEDIVILADGPFPPIFRNTVVEVVENQNRPHDVGPAPTIRLDRIKPARPPVRWWRFAGTSEFGSPRRYLNLGLVVLSGIARGGQPGASRGSPSTNPAYSRFPVPAFARISLQRPKRPRLSWYTLGIVKSWP